MKLAADELIDVPTTSVTSTSEELLLMSCSSPIAEGQVCWEVDSDESHTGTSSSVVQFPAPTYGFYRERRDCKHSDCVLDYSVGLPVLISLILLLVFLLAVWKMLTTSPKSH